MKSKRIIRLSLDLDEDMFRKFGVKCAKIGKKKSDVLRELLNKYLKE